MSVLWEHTYSDVLVKEKYRYKIQIVDTDEELNTGADLTYKKYRDIGYRELPEYAGCYQGDSFEEAEADIAIGWVVSAIDGDFSNRVGYFILPPTSASAPQIITNISLDYRYGDKHYPFYEDTSVPFEISGYLAEDEGYVVYKIASQLPIFETAEELNGYLNNESDGSNALNYVYSEPPVPTPTFGNTLWSHEYNDVLVNGKYHFKIEIVDDNVNVPTSNDICFKSNRNLDGVTETPFYSGVLTGERFEYTAQTGQEYDEVLEIDGRIGYCIVPPTEQDKPGIDSIFSLGYGTIAGGEIYEDPDVHGSRVPFVYEEFMPESDSYIIFRVASQLPIFETQEELMAYIHEKSDGSDALNYVYVEPSPDPPGPGPEPPSPNSVIDQFRISDVLYDFGARAANVGYDNTTSGMQATNLQDAVDTAMAAATSQKTISITPVQLTGTKVADITESRPSSGSISYSLYAPTPIQPTTVIVNDDVATDKLETIQVGDTVYECTAKAEDVSYIGETAGLLADDVQEAIDELAANKANSSDLATVATSGEFSDLLNIPLISDVAYSGDYDDLLNKPSFATVATTGDYSDLNSIPSFATVATTGNYSDLNNTPTLAAVATSGSYTDLNSTPNFAAVATTGSYTSLVDKPTIPAAANPNIASAYDSSHTYSIGDYCIYNDLMYVCTTDITVGESFDITHWGRTDVDAELDKKVKRINYSLTPQKTGIKWIVGTDLYQQTIRMLGTFTGDGEDITVWGQSNLYEEVSIAFIKEAFCFDNAGNIITLPYRTDRENNITANVCLNPQSKGLWFRIGPNDTYKDLYVTIWYTKFRLPVTNGLPVGKKCGLGSFVWNDTLTANIIADAKTQDSRIDITGEWMIQYVSAGEGGINVNLYTFDENSGYAYRRYIRTGSTSFGINMSDGIGYATDIVWHYFVANDGTLTFNGVEYRFPSMESLQITDTDFVMDNGEICLLPDHAIPGYPIDYSSNINNMLVTTTEYDDQGNYKTIKAPFVRKI